MRNPATYTITVEAKRTMFGKRSGRLTATLNPHDGASVAEAEGQSISEAKASLLQQLGELARYCGTRAYVLCSDGTILAVYYAQGWAYDILGPDRTFSTSCFMANDSYTETLQSAVNHANQSYGGVVKVL